MSSIAIISDVHGNSFALNEVLSDIDKKGIKTIYCLGDLVGYYCFFNEVIETIENLNIPCVLGNHDYALAYNNGVIERSKTCTNILKWQMRTLSDASLNFLKKLPEKIETDIFDKKALLIHAGLNDPIDEYLFDVNVKYLEQHNFNEDILITGHTHLPAYKKLFNGNIWLNPGSVGQPRDGDNRASYIVINDDLQIDFNRVEYDVKAVVTAMKKNGFESYISEPLINGKKIS